MVLRLLQQFFWQISTIFSIKKIDAKYFFELTINDARSKN
jgi:hypothetical protein